jgi:HEAT repeat protein
MKVAAFYPPRHPAVAQAVGRAHTTLSAILDAEQQLDLGLAEAGVVRGEDFLADSDKGLKAFAGFLLNRGIARIGFRRGLTRDALSEFLHLVATDPSHLAASGGLARSLAERGITSIEIGEIDLEKILASESEGVPTGTAPEGETWKRLVTDFLRSPDSTPGDGLRTLFRGLASDPAKCGEMLAHAAAAHPTEFPRLAGRLAQEILREVPESLPVLAATFGESLLRVNPETRMDLALSRIPLPNSSGDLMEALVSRMSEPMIVDLITSFVDAEGQLSPRLFAACAKIFSFRGRSEPYFAPVSARLRERSARGGSDLSDIWQSLQGLLVEGDRSHLSDTYRTTLETIAERAQPIDGALRRSLEASPGFSEGFSPDGISGHCARVVAAALDASPDSPDAESFRDELARRAARMSRRDELPLLGEMARAFVHSLPAEEATDGGTGMDRRFRAILDQLLAVYRREFERLSEEERGCVTRDLVLMKRVVAPYLVDALSGEENWEVRKGLIAAIASLGRAAVPALLRRLDDPSWYLVRNLALLLGDVGGAAVVEPLASLLQHEEPRVRREAATSLGKIGGPKSIEMLRRAIRDPEISSVAARVLGEIDGNHTVAFFSGRLERAGPILLNPSPLFQAIEILGEMEAAAAVPVLARVLSRGFWFPLGAGDALRAEAARALRRIGGSGAEAALQTGASSIRRVVREACLPARAPGSGFPRARTREPGRAD